jgi:hypothetical protein
MKLRHKGLEERTISMLNSVLKRNGKNNQAILKQVNGLAWLLDNSIELPIIRYRIGLDALIGVIPGFGDLAGLLLSSYIVTQAVRLGVPRVTLLHMLGNMAVEAVVGMVPLVGDVFDATFKANARNVKLLNQAVSNAQQGRAISKAVDTGAIVAILAALVGVIALIGALAVAAFSWVVSLFR